MAIIKVDNLTFHYPYIYDNIFEKTSFVLDTDWKLGFIGRNGKGKTTFLKLLQGEYAYDGQIISSVKFDYFPYDVGDKQVGTAEILRKIAVNAENWQFEKELSLLNVDRDVLTRPFCCLSEGEQTKVLLVGFFLKEGYFHLIDEPTNHLDRASRETVARYLKGKKGFIVVSHDRNFLDSCVDHILSLNRHTIEVQKGNYTSWKRNFDYRQSNERTMNEKLGKEIDKMKQDFLRKQQWADKIEASKIGNGACDRGYVGHMAARMAKRAKAAESRRQRAIEEKTALLKDVEETEQLKISGLRYRNNRLAEFKDVALFYGIRRVCSGVSFEVNNGDRIALQGRNGSGKSTLLKLIAGKGISYTGKVHIASDLTVSYVPQDTSFLKGSLDEFISDNGVDKTLFLTVLRKLDFDRGQFDKKMQDYSLGQKKKVMLARSLCQKANLYLWDEPLNYIDLYSRLQIEQLLVQSDITIIFVEHDSAFSSAVANKCVNLT